MTGTWMAAQGGHDGGDGGYRLNIEGFACPPRAD